MTLSMETSGGVGKNPYVVRPESKAELASVGNGMVGVGGVCEPQASAAKAEASIRINRRFIFGPQSAHIIRLRSQSTRVIK